MLFQLDELKKGKQEIVREIDLPQEELQIQSGTATIHNLAAKLCFRLDPLGYAMHYEVRAQVTCDCIRCGAPLELAVNQDDWVSLRVQQPEEAHILLDDSQMNVRFITDNTVDLKSLVLEVVDLALPSFPRHADGVPNCAGTLAADGLAEPKSSPFDVLSKFL